MLKTPKNRQVSLVIIFFSLAQNAFAAYTHRYCYQDNLFCMHNRYKMYKQKNTTMFSIIINLIPILITTIFLYFKVKHSYWNKLKVPTPNVSIPFGNAENIFPPKKPLFEIVDGLCKEMKLKNAKFFGVYFITTPEVVLVDPETIKHVLVKDFNCFVDRGRFTNKDKDRMGQHLANLGGDRWKNLRSKLTPTFTSGKIRSMFPIILEEVDNMMIAVDGMDMNPLNLSTVFTKFTTNIIGTIAFGMKIDAFKDDSSKFARICSRMSKPTHERLRIRLLESEYPKVMRIFGMKVSRKYLEDFFTALVEQTLDYRKTNNIRREDYIQILNDLKGTKDELSFVEMVSQAYLFFMAGFLTSSLTSTFCCFELAKNQDIQKILREEINGIQEFTYEKMNGLTYLNQCIQETLRLYPIIPEVTRVSNKAYKIPESDVTLPEGTKVFIPIYSIHRDEEYYPNPTKFDPERFSHENKQKRHPFAHLPFGEGPRGCLGERFGLMQTKLGVASIVKNYILSVSKLSKFEYDPLSVLHIATKEDVVVNATKI